MGCFFPAIEARGADGRLAYRLVRVGLLKANYPDAKGQATSDMAQSEAAVSDPENRASFLRDLGYKVVND
jgi:hypothetical protein